VNEDRDECDRIGINVWEVIDRGSHQAFGIMPFDPGKGLGGHCIPAIRSISPGRTKQAGGIEARFIRTWRATLMAQMPHFVLEQNKKRWHSAAST